MLLRGDLRGDAQTVPSIITSKYILSLKRLPDPNLLYQTEKGISFAVCGSDGDKGFLNQWKGIADKMLPNLRAGNHLYNLVHSPFD